MSQSINAQNSQLTTKKLPCVMPWSLINFGTETVVCVRAFSSQIPKKSEIIICNQPAKVREGLASRLVLSVQNDQGKKKNFPLDKISIASEQKIEQLVDQTVIIIEEDSDSANNRRYCYVADVKLKSNKFNKGQ